MKVASCPATVMPYFLSLNSIRVVRCSCSITIDSSTVHCYGDLPGVRSGGTGMMHHKTEAACAEGSVKKDIEDQTMNEL